AVAPPALNIPLPPPAPKNIKAEKEVQASPKPVAEEKPLVATKEEAETPPGVTPEEAFEQPAIIDEPQESPVKETEAGPEILNLKVLGELRAALPKATLDEILDELVDKARELTDLIDEAMRAEDMDDLAEKAHNL